MVPEWHKSRGYKHFDRRVAPQFITNAMDAEFVARHAFAPFLHYVKKSRRYKPTLLKTTVKERDIMYASHRDACILSYYGHLLNNALEHYYKTNDLGSCVIAYRSLGRSNYHFAAEAYQYACDNAPCVILAFDVTGFFDNLDHTLLKKRLKRILHVGDLSRDWLRVLRSVTKYHYVNLEDLKANAKFNARISTKDGKPIATVSELKAEGIPFRKNKRDNAGVPQGTPISAVLSNLYMIDFDQQVSEKCAAINALYRRYSDDILVICKPADAITVETLIQDLITAERLELSPGKTEKTDFRGATAPTTSSAAQYLGFSFFRGGAGIRPASLSKQWRKMRKAVRRAKAAAKAAGFKGKVCKVFTKKLRRQFGHLPFRNFSSYARRSAGALGQSQKVTRQLRKFQRRFERELQT